MLAVLSTIILLSVSTFVQASPVALEVHSRDMQELQKRDTSVIRQCAVSGTVAITFDDGPYNWNQRVRDNLQGSKGTFFINGNNYRCAYDGDLVENLKAMYAGGHTIGNHGWSHKDFTTLNWDQTHDELWRVEQLMIRVLGVKPLYFRPPYGKYNDLTLAALANRGYRKLVLWSEDSGDSVGASVQSSINVYNGIINSYPSPHLVLNHETIDSTSSQVLPNVVPRLKAKGYRIVAFDTCMGNQGEWPYQYVGQPQQRTNDWRC